MNIHYARFHHADLDQNEKVFETRYMNKPRRQTGPPGTL